MVNRLVVGETKNRWALTQEIRDKHIDKVRQFIGNVEGQDKTDVNREYLHLDLSDTGINPNQLRDLLEEIGYNFEYSGVDGVNFWTVLNKVGHTGLEISWCAMTFELKLNPLDC